MRDSHIPARSDRTDGTLPDASLARLDEPGLERYRALHLLAVAAVMAAQRPHPDGPGAAGDGSMSDRLRDDLILHLEMLEPVLEFGVLHPMIDYLRWLLRVHRARFGTHVQASDAVRLLSDFFLANMGPTAGAVVADALRAAQVVALSPMVTDRPLETPEQWTDKGALTTALLTGSQHDALDLLNRHLDAGGDLADYEVHVIQPALYEIGKRWEDNIARVADEHVATATARRVMICGALRTCRTHENGPRIVLACVEGNRHEIGLQMAADAFQLAGWNVLSLGADVPAGEIVQCAVDWQADVLGLSVAFAYQMKSVGEIRRRINANADRNRVSLIVGGIAAARYPWLGRAKGADAVVGTCLDAIPIANQWMSEPQP